MIRYIGMLVILTYSIMAVEIKMGGGVFNPKTKGLIFYQNNIIGGSQALVDNTEQYHGYIWTDLKLSLPYEPHILLEYTHMTSSGVSDFKLKLNYEGTIAEIIQTTLDNLIPVLSPTGENFLSLYSTLDTDIYDLFFYYDIYDDGFFPILSMGGGLKTFQYNFYVQALTDLVIKDNGGTSIPMLYTKIHKDIPKYFTFLEVGMKYYVFGDSDIYDLIAKMTIRVDLFKDIKGGIEFGYRDSNFIVKGSDIDNVGGDMRFQGLLIGATFYY